MGGEYIFEAFFLGAEGQSSQGSRPLVPEQEWPVGLAHHSVPRMAPAGPTTAAGWLRDTFGPESDAAW